MSLPAATAAPVSALRARLQAMGGLADLSRPLPPPWVFRPEPPEVPAERAAALGFVAEGAALVRRVRVDLRPFLERAGVDGPAAPPDLVRLLYRLPPSAPAGPFSDADTLILDIETLGLRGSGVVPFLVGVGVPRGRFLEVDQYLLADLDAEGPMLDAVAARVGTSRVLLTYNGRGFDIPVLRARCVINRRPERLGACTLRQAEVSLLGLVREDDVPGAEAPARFRAWLDGGPPSVLEGVIRHNQLDLCSTVVLGARLAAHAGGRLVEPVHPADRYRLAVHLEAVGMADAAAAHLTTAFRDAASPWSRPAGHRLARRLRRDTPGSQTAVLRELWRRHPEDLTAARGLAIALERRREIEAALAVCAEAEAVLASWAGWRRRLAVVAARDSGGSEAEWIRRRERLSRRARRGREAALPLAGSG
jgi:uncharacterized protein YprB with RNaseH-like and TPR domain